MNPNRLATAVLVPMAVALHSLGYYAARSVAFRHGMDALAIDSYDLSMWMASGQMASLFGLAASALLGAFVGAPACAGLGLILAAFGCLIQAFSVASWTFGAGMAISGFGVGMYRPAMVATLLRPFSGNWSTGRMAMLLVVYAASNAATLPTSMIAGWAMGMGSSATMGLMAVGALCSGSAALLYFLVLGVGFLGGPPLPAGSLAGGRLAVAALTVMVGGAAYGMWSFGSDMQWSTLAQYLGEYGSLLYLNPAIVVAASAVFAVALGASQAAGRSVPPLAVAGVGLLLAALGLFPTRAVDFLGLPVALACILAGALGEGLMFAGLMEAGVGGVHWRVAILPAAMITGASTGFGLFSNLIERVYPILMGGSMASLVGLGVGAAGLLLFGLAWPARRFAADTDEEAADSTVRGPDPYGFTDTPRD